MKPFSNLNQVDLESAKEDAKSEPLPKVAQPNTAKEIDRKEMERAARGVLSFLLFYVGICGIISFFNKYHHLLSVNSMNSDLRHLKMMQPDVQIDLGYEHLDALTGHWYVSTFMSYDSAAFSFYATLVSCIALIKAISAIVSVSGYKLVGTTMAMISCEILYSIFVQCYSFAIYGEFTLEAVGALNLAHDLFLLLVICSMRAVLREGEKFDHL